MQDGLVMLAQAAGQGSIFSSFLFPVGMMFLIFYLLVFRPQAKRQKQHQEFLRGLKPGDEIVTQGGVLGKVTKVEDAIVTIEVGEQGQKAKLRVLKSTVAARLNEALQQEQGKPVTETAK